MKRSVKAVLLSGAVSLASIAGANAADLLSAEPVEHVRICETYGAGFFYIPGTNTCVRMGGYVRFQAHAHSDNVADDAWEGDPFQITESNAGAHDTLSTSARGLVNFDARTETSHGTLRSFVQIRGEAMDEDSASVELDQAFMQFSGFTAGLAPSFFTVANPVEYFGTHNADFSEDTVLLGFTAEFGQGASATVAVESAERATDSSGDAILGPDVVTFGDTQTELPAAVANVNVQQSWGAATIAGAIAENKSHPVDESGSFVADEASKLGWAVSGGLTINLPALSEGGAFTAKASYSDGLTFYTLGSGSTVPSDFTWRAGALGDGPEKTEVFTVYSGLVHHWTENWRSNVGVGYASVDVNAGEESNAWGVTSTANVIWSPAKDLDVGLEVIYSHVDTEENAARALETDEGEDDGFGAIFRILRSFGS